MSFRGGLWKDGFLKLNLNPGPFGAGQALYPVESPLGAVYSSERKVSSSLQCLCGVGVATDLLGVFSVCVMIERG